jgi:hypothetical protein
MTDEDIEIAWSNAIFALTINRPADPKQLATLLRSDLPLPASIRDTLAELLAPTPGNPNGLLLCVKEAKTERQVEKDFSARIHRGPPRARIR